MSKAVVISVGLMSSIFTGFKTAFKGAFEGHKAIWPSIATRIPSSTREEKYGWLGQFPKMREWVGDRVFLSLSTSDYSIKNRKFEGSIKVLRDDVEDDQYGIFTPIAAELGLAGAELPDQLVFEALRAGTTTLCFDGQYFFDTDHPSFDKDGKPVQASNYQAGAGEPWYLLVTVRPLKPLIFQERDKVELQEITKYDSETVMKTDEFLYGTRGRCNVGYGFWQMAFRSDDTLNAANYEAAYKAIQSWFGEGGRPLNLTPDTCVTGPGNRGAAKRLFDRAETGGSSNEYYKDVAVISSPLVTA